MFHVGESIIAPWGDIYTIKGIDYTSQYYDCIDEHGYWQYLPMATADAQWRLMGLSLVTLAEGTGNDFDNLLSNVSALPLGTRFSLDMDMNLALLYARGYSSAADFAARELIPMLNGVGLTVSLPVPGQGGHAVMSGTVTKEWTVPQGASQYYTAGLPIWAIYALIGAALALIGLSLIAVISYFVFKATNGANQSAADQVKSKADVATAYLDAGGGPNKLQAILDAMDATISQPFDFLKYVPWILGIGGIAVVAYTLSKNRG